MLKRGNTQHMSQQQQQPQGHAPARGAGTSTNKSGIGRGIGSGIGSGFANKASTASAFYNNNPTPAAVPQQHFNKENNEEAYPNTFAEQNKRKFAPSFFSDFQI